MLVDTNNQFLNDYKKEVDKEVAVKNFRLYYKNKPTNLIWYDGKIMFIPKEYFLLKNLANLAVVGKHICSLYAYDLALIDELKDNKINFILDANLEELLSRIAMAGMKNLLTDKAGAELISDQDYSQFNEPIYLGDGFWLNEQ